MALPPPQPLLILGTSLFAEELADLVPGIPGFQVAGFVQPDDIPFPLPVHVHRLVGLVRRQVRRWTGRTMDYWREVFPPLKWPDRVVNLSRRGKSRTTPEASGRAGSRRLTINGMPVFSEKELADLTGSHQALCGLNAPGYRRRFTARAEACGLSFATLVHPTAILSPTSRLGSGCFVNLGAIIASRTQVGSHVIINRGVVIGHHVEVEDYATFGPGAKVAGSCVIGQGAYIGIGAVILDRLNIGAGAVVGGGSVVTRDVPSRAQVVGVPARIVKQQVSETWDNDYFTR